MSRSLYVIAILTTALGVVAQDRPGSQSSSSSSSSSWQFAGSNQGNSPTVVVTPPGPSIYILAGGIYGTGVYVTAPATWPVQGAGISLADRAGISLEAPLQTGATYLSGTPMYNQAPMVAETTPAYTGAAAPDSGKPSNDLGPSYFAGAYPEGVAGQPAGYPSLGEIAAQYKKAGPRNVRMYTNADAERIANTITIRGVGTTVTPPPQNPPAQKPPNP